MESSQLTFFNQVSHNIGGAGVEPPEKKMSHGSRFEPFSKRNSHPGTALESPQGRF